MSNLLYSASLDTELKKIKTWTLNTQEMSISKEWEFHTFKSAMRFFLLVGELAENYNHHPEFLSNFKKMKIKLTTHDVSGITHKDIEMALMIDQLVNNEFSEQLCASILH